MIRLELTHGTLALRRACPIGVAELRDLVKCIERAVVKLPEFATTAELLGGRPTSLALHFCDDEHMRSVQRQFRNLDRTTDILSFPTRELAPVHRLAADRSLGDLLVSLPAIARGASRGRRSEAAELAEVLVHGVLHLLGLDHVKGGAGAARMRGVQAAIFRDLRRELPIVFRARGAYKTTPWPKPTPRSRKIRKTS